MHRTAWSPFADVDQGLGLHGSMCSCQRCKQEDGADLDGSLSRADMKGMQSSATPGPALVLHSDADRREFISAGAAGGLAVCLWPLQQRFDYQRDQSLTHIEQLGVTAACTKDDFHKAPDCVEGQCTL